MEKLGISRDADLFTYAKEHGWLSSSQTPPRDAN
jgi:two-component system capsular synthesis response regulator RcsB